MKRCEVRGTVMHPSLGELVSRVTRRGAGNGLEDGVAVGPLVDDGAIEKVDRQVQDAVSKGATLLFGGHRLMETGLDRGTFYAPTVLADVRPDMLIYREETFGPVAPVNAFGKEEEAPEVAHDTHHGTPPNVSP